MDEPAAEELHRVAPALAAPAQPFIEAVDQVDGLGRGGDGFGMSQLGRKRAFPAQAGFAVAEPVIAIARLVAVAFPQHVEEGRPDQGFLFGVGDADQKDVAPVPFVEGGLCQVFAELD